MSGRIPLSEPVINDADVAAVVAALRSGWVSSGGPLVTAFEQAIAECLAVPHAVATVNGTAALHLACAAIDLRPGDGVIVPALTFIGTANPVVYCGATPILADVRESDGTIDTASLHSYLDGGSGYSAATDLPSIRIKAVIAVHLYGAVAELGALLKAASPYRIKVLEDAAEALGSRLANRAAGTIGDIGCLSFNGNKIITTGGGGMVLTHNEKFARKARHLSTQARASAIGYWHDEVGFNYRLTNLQAALGVSQLASLDSRLQGRNAIAQRYREGLEGLPLRFLESAPGTTTNNWLIAIVLDRAEDRARLEAGLQRSGIEARRFFVPLHRLRPYRSARRTGSLRVADQLFDCGLNLPSSAGMTLGEADRVVEVIRSILRHSM